jgi:hypothetical protein
LSFALQKLPVLKSALFSSRIDIARTEQPFDIGHTKRETGKDDHRAESVLPSPETSDFIGSHKEVLFVAAMRRLQSRSFRPSRSTAETQRKLQPPSLRLSAMIF